MEQEIFFATKVSYDRPSKNEINEITDPKLSNFSDKQSTQISQTVSLQGKSLCLCMIVIELCYQDNKTLWYQVKLTILNTIIFASITGTGRGCFRGC